jgi:hypothetical protein
MSTVYNQAKPVSHIKQALYLDYPSLGPSEASLLTPWPII